MIIRYNLDVIANVLARFDGCFTCLAVDNGLNKRMIIHVNLYDIGR